MLRFLILNYGTIRRSSVRNGTSIIIKCHLVLHTVQMTSMISYIYLYLKRSRLNPYKCPEMSAPVKCPCHRHKLAHNQLLTMSTFPSFSSRLPPPPGPTLTRLRIPSQTHAKITLVQNASFPVKMTFRPLGPSWFPLYLCSLPAPLPVGQKEKARMACPKS